MIPQADSGKSIQLLLVEDDDVDQEKIIRLLKKASLPFNIVTATSAAKAVDLVKQHIFDFVILDYRNHSAK